VGDSTLDRFIEGEGRVPRAARSPGLVYELYGLTEEEIAIVERRDR
jgi:hypothetical protein